MKISERLWRGDALLCVLQQLKYGLTMGQSVAGKRMLYMLLHSSDTNESVLFRHHFSLFCGEKNKWRLDSGEKEEDK